MQQPPTAAELLATVMEVLGDEVVPSLTGPVQHHARVAANLVAIVERELRLGGDAASREHAAIAALLDDFGDGDTHSDLDLAALRAKLASELRRGMADDDATNATRVAHADGRRPRRPHDRQARPRRVGRRLMSDTLQPALAAWLSGQEGRTVTVDGTHRRVDRSAPRQRPVRGTRDGTSRRLALTMIPTAAIQLLDIRDEAGVRLLAESAGVPVPHVHHVCSDEAVLGGPFFISTAVDGETVPRRVLRLASENGVGERIVDQLGEAMARLHSIDPAAAPATIPRPEGARADRDRASRSSTPTSNC